MINVIFQRLKEQKNSILYYAAGFFGYTLLMVSMFPQMKTMDMEALISSYPEQMQKFFGQENFAAFAKFEGFISLEYLSFFFILIIAFYLGSAAGSAIAGQIDKKTLDFELSQPISRTKYLAGHILVGLFYSLALVFFQTIIIWILCNAYNISIKDDGLIAFGILAIFFVWAIFGIAVLFTSIFRSKIAVTLVTVVLTLGFYLFTSLTNLIDRLKDYEKISLFYLYSPQKALETGNLNINYLIILAAILIICTALSLLIFNKKDV